MEEKEDMKVLVEEEEKIDKIDVKEKYREEIEDEIKKWMVGEIEVEMGEVELRLIDGRSIEEKLEYGGEDGEKIEREIEKEDVDDGEDELFDL